MSVAVRGEVDAWFRTPMARSRLGKAACLSGVQNLKDYPGTRAVKMVPK